MFMRVVYRWIKRVVIESKPGSVGVNGRLMRRADKVHPKNIMDVFTPNGVLATCREDIHHRICVRDTPLHVR